MKVNHEKLLRALLAKAYKMQDGDIDEILNSSEDDGQETALTSILDKDSARITALKKPKEGQTFQDGYAKGKKEVLSNFETELKEKFDIESDAQGLDLVDAVLATKVKAGKPKDLTDDDIKRTPVYQNLEKASKKALTDKETEFNNKLSEVEKGFKKNQTFQTVGERAITALEALNPVFSANPKVAATQRKTFLDQFKEFEFEIGQDNRILVSKDGKLLEDKHGHSLDFDNLVKERAAEHFDFKANNGGTNSGNGKPGDKKPDGGTPPADGDKPAYKAKDEDDLTNYMSDYKNTPAERIAAQKQWDTDHAPAQ